MLHCNSNTFYILRGSTDSESWATVNGYWPLSIDLTNNNATFGGTLNTIGAITQNGSQVITAGNKGSYTFPPETHTHANLTFNNGGTGDASGTIYNAGTARTISYNTIGAPST